MRPFEESANSTVRVSSDASSAMAVVTPIAFSNPAPMNKADKKKIPLSPDP